MSTDLTIVVPARNEGRNVLDTVRSLLRHTSGSFEVVVVDDGSTDGSLAALRALAREDPRLRLLELGGLGPARCRNRGARLARGRYLAFVDAHCFAPAGWLEPVMALLEGDAGIGVAGPAIGDTDNVRLRGCGGTWIDDSLNMHWLGDAGESMEVPFQPAGCQVVRRHVFEAVGGYDEGLTRWGSEDVEFCLRVWLFGWSIQVQPRATVYHHFRTQPPYYVDFRQIVYNRLRLCFLHFDDERLARVLRPQLAVPFAEHALVRLHGDGTRERGTALRARRVRDMEWFCQRFGLLS
jgi:glycosyltransferase involved in cell wall biosynthesis